MSAIFDAPIDPITQRIIARIRLCQEFPGWTLEYVDNLLDNDPFTVADIWGVIDGQAKVHKQHAVRARIEANHKG